MGASVVKACLADKLAHGIYHVGGGCAYSVSEFCDQVKAAVPGAVIEIGAGAGATNAPSFLFDISRARGDFGYEPRFPPARAVLDWKSWLRERA